MLFQGEGEAFNVGAFLESISPYAWASTGIALCIGLSVVGAAWSVIHHFAKDEGNHALWRRLVDGQDEVRTSRTTAETEYV